MNELVVDSIDSIIVKGHSNKGSFVIEWQYVKDAEISITANANKRFLSRNVEISFTPYKTYTFTILDDEIPDIDEEEIAELI